MTAQTLTKVTSLAEINETDSYVLQHNGTYGYTGTTYFYASSADATLIACSTSIDTSNKGYFFKFEIDSDGTYQIKNEILNAYVSEQRQNYIQDYFDKLRSKINIEYLR